MEMMSWRWFYLISLIILLFLLSVKGSLINVKRSMVKDDLNDENLTTTTTMKKKMDEDNLVFLNDSIKKKTKEEEEEDQQLIKGDDQSENRRYVFAHVVQGNSQNYTKDQWIQDMRVAQDAYIDGFAINIGTDPTNDLQLKLIYEAAQETDFKIFISFDMNYYSYPDSSKDILSRTLEYSKQPAQFKYKGRVFLSSFSGEVPGTYMDGNPNYTSAWCSLKASLRGHGVETYFVPGWTGIKPSTSRCADGLLSWDAWPHNPLSSSPSSEQITKNLTVQDDLFFPDQAIIEASHQLGKTYMAPISALFFKHLSNASLDNYVYKSDDWMMINRYTKLIQLDHLPEFIELLTWNDYGESHYLRDPQPLANLPMNTISAHEYVDGFSHSALLDLISYFNRWYKDGKPPVMNKTTMYVWYRPHIKNAVATSDLLPIPAFANMTEDRIYGFVIPSINTTVSSIRITSGYQILEESLLNLQLNQTSSSFNASSHLCQIEEDLNTNNQIELLGSGFLFSTPFQPGLPIFEFLDQDHSVLNSLQGLEIQVEPQIYNFNYWSASISV